MKLYREMRIFTTSDAVQRDYRPPSEPFFDEPAPMFAQGTVDLSADPWDRPVTEVMTSPVFALRPDHSVGEAETMLRARCVRGAPIIDDAGRIQGMISRGDLTRAIEADALAVFSPLSEVMMCFAFALPTRASLAQVAALMAYEKVHRIVITDDDHRLVGIVSSLDLVAWIGEQAGHTGLRRSR